MEGDKFPDYNGTGPEVLSPTWMLSPNADFHVPAFFSTKLSMCLTSVDTTTCGYVLFYVCVSVCVCAWLCVMGHRIVV